MHLVEADALGFHIDMGHVSKTTDAWQPDRSLTVLSSQSPIRNSWCRQCRTRQCSMPIDSCQRHILSLLLYPLWDRKKEVRSVHNPLEEPIAKHSQHTDDMVQGADAYCIVKRNQGGSRAWDGRLRGRGPLANFQYWLRLSSSSLRISPFLSVT